MKWQDPKFYYLRMRNNVYSAHLKYLGNSVRPNSLSSSAQRLALGDVTTVGWPTTAALRNETFKKNWILARNPLGELQRITGGRLVAMVNHSEKTLRLMVLTRGIQSVQGHSR
jgi:hypothetical protein